MLEGDVAERLKLEALKKGISVSAMAAILIKQSLGREDLSIGQGLLEDRVRSIIALAEQEGLL